MAISSNPTVLFLLAGPHPRSPLLGGFAPHSGRRPQNSSCNFDALAPFAGSGKPDQLAAALTFGRRLCGKEVTRKPREIGIAVRLASLQLDAAFLELRDRALSPSGTVTSACGEPLISAQRNSGSASDSNGTSSSSTGIDD